MDNATWRWHIHITLTSRDLAAWSSSELSRPHLVSSGRGRHGTTRFWGAALVFESWMLSIFPSNCSQIQGENQAGFRWKNMTSDTKGSANVSSQLSLNSSDILTDVLWLHQGATRDPVLLNQGGLGPFYHLLPPAPYQHRLRAARPSCMCRCADWTAPGKPLNLWTNLPKDSEGTRITTAFKRWILTDYHDCQVAGMPSTSTKTCYNYNMIWGFPLGVPP